MFANLAEMLIGSVPPKRWSMNDTRRHNPEDQSQHIHRCEKLKSFEKVYKFLKK
jgi:hypothetical protein